MTTASEATGSIDFHTRNLTAPRLEAAHTTHMRSPNHSDDGIRISFLSRKNDKGSYLIDLLEYTEATDPAARFLAIPHRGYSTAIEVSLLGQGPTAVAAIARCRRKLRGFGPEQIQETPEGTWFPIPSASVENMARC